MSNTTNTTTLSTTTTLSEKDLIRPLRTFPSSVVITKELLLLRVAIARTNLKSQVIDSGAWHNALCSLDCCKWDLEGFLQK